MCEFCWCSSGSSVRDRSQTRMKGRPIGVRVVAVGGTTQAPRLRDSATIRRVSSERSQARYSHPVVS